MAMGYVARDPEKMAMATVEKLVSNFDPVPSILSINSKKVSIVDFVHTIEKFRRQLVLLNNAGHWWPSVFLNMPTGFPSDNGYWAPLDITESVDNPASLAVQDWIQRITNGDAQRDARHLAEDAGFHVRDTPPSEVKRTFIEKISEIIGKRPSILGDDDNNPPLASFSVTTNSPGIEILYANGYFVKATGQGFGYSTPASRLLPWGGYTFGWKLNGVCRFDGTVWTVPTDTSIHLQI